MQFAGRLIDLGMKYLEGCKTVASCNDTFSTEHLLRMRPSNILHTGYEIIELHEAHVPSANINVTRANAHTADNVCRLM